MRLSLAIISFIIPLLCCSQSLTDSLAAKFLFNGNTNDTSGHNRNASIVGTGISLTSDRYGNPNRAYNFNGSGGSIRANVGFHTEEVTVTLWYYSDDQTTPYPHFFDYGDYKLRCHVMWGSIYNSNDQYGILYESYNPQGNMLRGGIKPPNSVWTHVAVTFNKNTGKEKLYINGVFDKEMNIGSGPLNLSDDIFCIGRVRSGPANQTSMTHFKGKIDDVYIYSRELHVSEIATLAGKGGDGIPNSIESYTETQRLLTLYPNPATHLLSFSFASEVTSAIRYEITDITGKLIHQGNDNTPIDISKYTAGIYLFTLYDENNTLLTSEKFIKE